MISESQKRPREVFHLPRIEQQKSLSPGLSLKMQNVWNGMSVLAINVTSALLPSAHGKYTHIYATKIVKQGFK